MPFFNLSTVFHSRGFRCCMSLRMYCPYPSLILINWMWPFHKHYTHDVMWMCRSILAFPIYEMWCFFAVKVPISIISQTGTFHSGEYSSSGCDNEIPIFFLLITVFLFGHFPVTHLTTYWSPTFYEVVWNNEMIVFGSVRVRDGEVSDPEVKWVSSPNPVNP